MTRLGIICSNKALATMNNGRKSRLEEHKKGANREETKIQTNEKKSSTHSLTWFFDSSNRVHYNILSHSSSTREKVKITV